MTSATRDRSEQAQVRLEIEGMTCASCAARIEKRLNHLDSVEAAVNFASETASIRYDPGRVQVDELIEAVRSSGYDAALPTELQEEEDGSAPLIRRLVVAACLSAPLAALAMVPGLDFPGWRWLSLGLSTLVVLWAGWQFHRAAALNLRHHAATMDTLISVGTLAAWSWSAVVVLLGLDAPVYFEVGAIIVTLILLGRFFEIRARRRSGEAIRRLVKLSAKEAHVLRDGVEVTVPVSELVVGDLFVVRPGEKIATDGAVEEGFSAVDQSVVTGESVPADVGPGSTVIGATINTSGRLVVRATRVGADTALAQIARMVVEAQAGKAGVQRLADRVSAVFVPIVIGLSAITLAAWLLLGGTIEEAFTAAVAVLIIACPCALGLATPTAIMVGTGRGAQLGILIKGPEVLEQTRRVTTIVLDKTGTITDGRMTVAAVIPAPGWDTARLLSLVGAAESASEHPIAAAIAEHARGHTSALPALEQFRSHAGLGVEAVVAGRRVWIGRPAFLEERGVALTGDLDTRRRQQEALGRTVVAAAADGRMAGLIAVADTVKPTSLEAIAELRRIDLTPVLLTGDNEPAARAVAAEVGIDIVIAGVLPDQKAAQIARLQESGERVAMVGDGVNDAPALARADLGLAIGTGTDIAIEASDVTLVSGDLRAAPDAIRLARRTLRTIKGNLFWAFAYNVAAIPLAAVGLLNPIIAAGTMAFSSVFVVSNSLRLRRFRSTRAAAEVPHAGGGAAIGREVMT